MSNIEDIENVRSFLFEFKDGTELRLVEKENYDKLVKRIKELEEENLHWRGQYLIALDEIGMIPKQKVKDKIEEIKEDKESKYFDKFIITRDIDYVIEILEELLEDK